MSRQSSIYKRREKKQEIVSVYKTECEGHLTTNQTVVKRWAEKMEKRLQKSEHRATIFLCLHLKSQLFLKHQYSKRRKSLQRAVLETLYFLPIYSYNIYLNVTDLHWLKHRMKRIVLAENCLKTKLKRNNPSKKLSVVLITILKSIKNTLFTDSIVYPVPFLKLFLKSPLL